MDPSLLRIALIVGVIAAMAAFGSTIMFVVGLRLARRLERQEDELAALRSAQDEARTRRAEVESRMDFAERRLAAPPTPVPGRKDG